MNATPTTSPTTSPTAPSAGAVRAALALSHCKNPPNLGLAYRSGVESAVREINVRAAIIDRETRAKELLAKVKAIADDYIPSNDSESRLALAEMRGALIELVESHKEGRA